MALPDFPWDSLADATALARTHPDGIVDLSVGTPVDPTPALVQDALRAAADAPGYPLTAGSPALLAAARGWARRTLGAADPDRLGVLPTVGSKELVAWLPTLLGLGPGDEVLVPALAYPTYAVGALLAGATPVTAPSPRVRLVWVNSPSNPTGAVLPATALHAAVQQARASGAVLASDECYLELGFDPAAAPVSALSAAVCGADPRGVLAVSSLSKRSNLAGYRLGFVLGDPQLVAGLLAARKHAGMIVPAPVQAAGVAALGDDDHVADQRRRYAARRGPLAAALRHAGFRLDGGPAGLYLWASRDEPCADSVRWLAERGILVAPGAFYGEAGAHHVRVALTATDERVAAAVTRLTAG